MQNFDVIVIGAGPGGIEAALQAKKAGFSVLLISGSKLGGRAVWGSLVPSKVWLTVAEKMDDLRSMHLQGLLVEDIALDMEVIKERINQQSTNASQRYYHQLTATGVVIEQGQARLRAPHQVALACEDGTTQDYFGKYIVIATGSEPIFGSAIKPDGVHIVAPRHTAALEEIPSSLVIVGGGITGMEYAYAFAALGAEVTVVQRNTHFLPGFDQDMVQRYQKHLAERYNLHFISGQGVTSMTWKEDEDESVVTVLADGRTLKSQVGLLAMGRRPDLTFYDSQALQFEQIQGGFLAVNDYQQTSMEHIYAVGDITGNPMMANKALWQARKVVKHLLDETFPTSIPLMEAIFTQPPFVQLGTPPAHPHRILDLPLYALLKSHLSGQEEGLLRLFLDPGQRITCAVGFGLHLPEIMAVIQTGMQQGMTWNNLSLVPFGYPSTSEIITSQSYII